MASSLAVTATRGSEASETSSCIEMSPLEPSSTLSYLSAVSRATAASGIAKSPNATATVADCETGSSSRDASSGGV